VTAPSTDGDRQLLLNARAGDEDSFRRLVEIYTPRVFALVRNLVRSQSEAEDVTQEVFFKVHRKLDSFREDSSFYTWLYRVSVNTAHDWTKKQRKERAIQVEDFGAMPLADETDGPDESLRRRDLRSKIREAMSRLPETFRTILVLRELEGLRYEEISSVLQISKGTVESRIFRARAKLKDELDRRHIGPQE